MGVCSSGEPRGRVVPEFSLEDKREVLKRFLSTRCESECKMGRPLPLRFQNLLTLQELMKSTKSETSQTECQFLFDTAADKFWRAQLKLGANATLEELACEISQQGVADQKREGCQDDTQQVTSNEQMLSPTTTTQKGSLISIEPMQTPLTTPLQTPSEPVSMRFQSKNFTS